MAIDFKVFDKLQANNPGTEWAFLVSTPANGYARMTMGGLRSWLNYSLADIATNGNMAGREIGIQILDGSTQNRFLQQNKATVANRIIGGINVQNEYNGNQTDVGHLRFLLGASQRETSAILGVSDATGVKEALKIDPSRDWYYSKHSSVTTQKIVAIDPGGKLVVIDKNQVASGYTLPTMAGNQKGGARVGNHLSMNGEYLNVDVATTSRLGVVRPTTGGQNAISINSGLIDVRRASPTQFGVVKIGARLSMNADGVLSADVQSANVNLSDYLTKTGASNLYYTKNYIETNFAKKSEVGGGGVSGTTGYIPVFDTSTDGVGNSKMYYHSTNNYLYLGYNNSFFNTVMVQTNQSTPSMIVNNVGSNSAPALLVGVTQRANRQCFTAQGAGVNIIETGIDGNSQPYVIFGNVPSSKPSQTGRIYKDSNGFLKIV